MTTRDFILNNKKDEEYKAHSVACIRLSMCVSCHKSFANLLFSIGKNPEAVSYKAQSRITEAEATIAQKLNQTSCPENAQYSFSDALFWFFFGHTKKNNNTFRLSMNVSSINISKKNNKKIYTSSLSN